MPDTETEGHSYDEDASKRQAVAFWFSSGKSGVQIARELGIDVRKLYAWKKAFSAIPSTRTGKQSIVEDSVLKQENDQLRQECAFLRGKLDSTVASASPPDDSQEIEMERELVKSQMFYEYSTEVLLNEHERFSKADDKAAKYLTMFVFLLGIIAYFDKWIFDRMIVRGSLNSWPIEMADILLMATGLSAIFTSAGGWYISSRVIKLRPFLGRPLNQAVLTFFDENRLLDIYDSFGRKMIQVYAENAADTSKKYVLLKWADRLMGVSLLFLIELVIMYCLYSWI